MLSSKQQMQCQGKCARMQAPTRVPSRISGPGYRCPIVRTSALGDAGRQWDELGSSEPSPSGMGRHWQPSSTSGRREPSTPRSERSPPSMQDWRAYRAKLVSMEKSGGITAGPSAHHLWSAPSWPQTPQLAQPPAAPRTPRPATAPSSSSSSSSSDTSQRPFTRSALPPARPTTPHAQRNAGPPSQPACSAAPGTSSSSHPALRPSSHPILRGGSCKGQAATTPCSSSPPPFSSFPAASPAPSASAAAPHGSAWAHPLAVPEVGCLLVARAEGGMAFFNHAVVLITSHDAQHGTVGLVLNKLSQVTVSDLQVTAAASGFQSAFAASRLMLGGPVHLDHVTLVHRFRGAAGSTKLAEGLYTGGLPAAVKLVQAGLANPSDFLLVLGVSGWAPGQLAREVQAGFWQCVAADPDIVLPAPGPCPALGPAEQQAPAPAAPAPSNSRVAKPAASKASKGGRAGAVPPLQRPQRSPKAASAAAAAANAAPVPSIGRTPAGPWSDGLEASGEQQLDAAHAMWSRVMAAAGL